MIVVCLDNFRKILQLITWKILDYTDMYMVLDHERIAADSTDIGFWLFKVYINRFWFKSRRNTVYLLMIAYTDVIKSVVLLMTY